jgi:cobalt-zinc-cadmium efflux system protein
VELRRDFARAKRLEWWTLGATSTVLLVMYFALGGSQAMRTAFVEDLLSLVPAITFLIAAKLEPHEPTAKYPFGLVRVNSLAFLVSAVVLTVMGGVLLFESVLTLVMREHPTVGPVKLFGQTVWSGWVMIAALAYSVVVPMVLGHLKEPVARRLCDKVLHTDALMQKADWMTGVAGIGGVLGIAFGLWWADALAAGFISLSILQDGLKSIRTASAELLDGAPRRLDSAEVAEDAQRLKGRLEARWPQATVRLRESGRYLMASLDNVPDPGPVPPLAELMGDDAPWRLAHVSFSPHEAAGAAARRQEE